MKAISYPKFPKVFFQLFKHTFSEKPKRKDYSYLLETDKCYFTSIVGSDSVILKDLDSYNTDWTHKYKGNSKLVLKPKSTEEISKILKHCNSRKLAVVPQGGNTGLVGGSNPVYDEIIINLSKMDKILNFDEISNTLHVEAGCILSNLENFLNEKGYEMPLDLGAKGSCFIGGNLATNAGGIHFVKHGSLRSNCKGIKAVLANGNLVNFMNPLPKNNTGYDLKQLFIGSEGTLGIITEALINVFPKLKFKDVAIIAVNSFEDIVKIYQIAKSEIKEKLNAIEFFDSGCLELSEKHGNMKSPFEALKNQFYLILEFASNDENNREELENFIAKLDFINDGIVAQDEKQFRGLWELRERIAECAVRNGLCLKYDVSLSLSKFYELVELTRNKVGNLAVVVGYGHIGDYNLHINVCYNRNEKDETFRQIENIVEPWIFDYLKEINGSISAEHGVGLQKSKYLDRNHSQANLDLMRSIKKTMDENWIMNPYKVLE